jgi:hypothetical protein
MFKINTSMGIDAQSFLYDTVLELRSAECNYSSASLACSDDSSPPGEYGSRVSALLTPGTYYLVVDGFDSTQWGPFNLSLLFRPACASSLLRERERKESS